MKIDPTTRRKLAADLFNHTWTLLEKPDRTPAEDDEMIHSAHASRFHWGEVGEPFNLARGEWQCSRVYAVLGRAEPALWHARRCLAINEANGETRGRLGPRGGLRGDGPRQPRGRRPRRGGRLEGQGDRGARRHRRPGRSRAHRGRPRDAAVGTDLHSGPHDARRRPIR